MATATGIRAGRAFVELFVDDARLVRGLRRAQAKLAAFGSSISRMGQQLLTAGTLAATPLALATRTFAGFEAQMARVRALTGAQAEDFARLEAEAKRLGATTVFSASQAAEAMSYFALAGFDVERILGAIGPALDLAAAGQIEIAQAADIAAKIMAGMGLSADELGNAVDVIAKAMTTANTDLLMLGDAFKFVGPMAKTAGLSLEEITAAIQLLSNAGVQGEMAGTTLRGMLLSLTSPSAEAERELARLGVRVLDDAGNVRSLTAIITDLEHALTGVGSGEKLRSLGTIFPARQAAGAAELVMQGADRLREATAALGDSTGTASRIAGVQLDTLKGDVTILLSALEGVAIAVGEAFGQELRAAVRGVTSFLAALGTWITENHQVVLTTVGIVSGLLAAGVALIGLGSALGVAGFAAGALATGVGVIGSLLTALASPIGLVTVALVGLGAYMITTTDVGVRALAWLGEKFGWLRTTALATFQGIGDAIAAGDLSLAAKVLWLGLSMVWQQGIQALESRWLDFKGFFVEVFRNAVYDVAGLLVDGWAGLQVAWLETLGLLTDGWSVFIVALQQGWHRFAGFFAKVWERLRAALGDTDAEAEIRRINEAVAARDRELQQGQNDQLLQREQERRRQLAAIEQQRRGSQEQLGAMQAQETADRQRQQLAARSASEQRLAQARADWEAALQEAAARRAAIEPSAPNDAPDPLERLRQQLADVGSAGGALDQAESRSVGVQGTFNAAALRGFGAADAADRTARSVEAMDRKLGLLVREAQHGGLVFG